MTRPRLLVPALSVTLIISWGSLFYAFAMLMQPVRHTLHWSAELTVGAYSLALVTWGLCTYPVGRIIDRWGGRQAMATGSVLAGSLFIVLGQVQSPWAFYAVWLGLGVAMALTLYEPAFAVMVAAHPGDYRRRIGLLTLTGGFASTVFWPLTHGLVGAIGWRHTVLVFGVLHLLVCAPLHWFAVPATGRPRLAAHGHSTPPEAAPPANAARSLLGEPAFWLMGLCFMAFGFVTAAMAVHVVPLLASRGLAPGAAIALAAMIGPMQSSGRLAEILIGPRLSPLTLGRATVWLIPLGMLALLFAADLPGLFYVFIALYGAGLGLITLVRATTPAEIFGRARYASVSGALGGPAILARAAGPYAATAMLSAFAQVDVVLWLLAGVSAVGAMAYAGATRRGLRPDAGDART